MPRLRGRWRKSVIGSVHHCTCNLPRIETISQLSSNNYFKKSLT